MINGKNLYININVAIDIRLKKINRIYSNGTLFDANRLD